MTKSDVRDFWNAESCGERFAVGGTERQRFDEQFRKRYELEPFILPFAEFATAEGLDVLEIGVGMGADHLRWARAHPRTLVGIDLTERAVQYTASRLSAEGFMPNVRCADGESLPFPDESFDLVYSWGVLHHSPDTRTAVAEVRRVLRAGGRARIMIYHRRSIVGMLLWVRYALLTLRPRRSLTEIYAQYLESPGTKSYSRTEARDLFREFSAVDLTVELSPGDLLMEEMGQRHAGLLLRLARAVWPRDLIRRFGRACGLYLLVSARR